MVDLGDPGTTINANAIARYDIGDDTMIYVWLGKGMDAADAKPTEKRMLDVVVKCEDGTVQMAPDRDGVLNQPIKIPAPGMLTMIDPMSMEKSMGEIGMYTDKCDGNRGVLRITMPDNSHAGMVFSHISQMEGHYRMNFPGYSMAVSGLGGNDGMTEIEAQRCTDTSETMCR